MIKPTTYIQAYISMLNIKDQKFIKVDEYDELKKDDIISLYDKGLLPKTMSGESFLKLWKRNTLLQKAKYNLIETAYQKQQTGEGNVTIMPLVADSDELIHELYKYAVDTNKFISKTILGKTLNEWRKDKLKNFKSGENKLSKWLSVEEYKQIIEDSLVNFCNSCDIEKHKNTDEWKFTPKTLDNSLFNLYNLLFDLDFELHIGHAGCGKSSGVAKQINSLKEGSVYEVSLSNTICNMFKQKIYNKNIKFEAMSCTKARLNISKLKNADIVVIDEFSQWGYYELDLLIELIENNKKAKFLIMGDIDQIPSFLSGGSLLYSIKTTFPNKVISYETQYRFVNKPDYMDLITSVQNKQWPDNVYIQNLNKDIIRQSDCIITGWNKNVDKMNLLCLNYKLDSEYTEEEYKTFGFLFNLAKEHNEIPVIATETGTIKYNNDSYKISANTRYTIENVIDAGHNACVILKSCIDNSKITCTKYDFCCKFKLCYAITVNKSQGLEWENVIVYITQYDKNLLNYNALYVAVSRGRNRMIMTTDTNPQITVTKQDLSKTLNKTYTFKNDLDFTKLETHSQINK